MNYSGIPEIPKLSKEVLDAELWAWNQDPGRYTLDTGLWAVDTVIVSFRTETELSF